MALWHTTWCDGVTRLFHISTQAARVIFQAPTRRAESVPNGKVHIFVRRPQLEMLRPSARLRLRRLMAEARSVSNHDLPARHRHVDADLKGFSPPVMPVRRLDDDAAPDDPLAEVPALCTRSQHSLVFLVLPLMSTPI